MFSGLNLGLMSLTVEDLNIIIASSDDAQQIRFAKTILPMRRRGNLLLCTLLIGNTLVNVSLAVLTDPIWTYLFGTSTVGAVLSLALPSAIIVVLGEIVPQSVCSRHALSIGLSPSPSSSRPPPARFFSLSLCWRAHTLALSHSHTRALAHPVACGGCRSKCPSLSSLPGNSLSTQSTRTPRRPSTGRVGC